MGRDAPPLEVVDAADALVGVLHYFREEKGEGGGRHLGGASLVEGAVIDVRACAGLGCAAGGVDGGRGWEGKASRGACC